jgi:hypothetical protein
VHCARNQLLAGAGFSIYKDRRVSRRYDLDLLKDVAQNAGVPDDVVELHFGADLIFEVDFLAGKLLFELVDLAVCQGVIECDRNLLRNLHQQCQILFAERLVLDPRHRQDAQCPMASEQRARAAESQLFAGFHRDLCLARDVMPGGFATAKNISQHGTLDGNQYAFARRSNRPGKIESVKTQVLSFGNRYTGGIAAKGIPDAPGDGT